MRNASAPPEVDPEDGDTRVDTTYVTHLSKHLDYVRAHLAGKDKSGRLPPSFLSPSAHWTSAEKDIFFHALAIYSRLRPDLIAEEIKTKTVVDVCLYIHCLEDGVHATGPTPRKDFQIAMQVSDAFVALEEQKAQPLLAAEPLWEDRALEEDRQLELEAREKAVRARKGEAQSETHEEYRRDVKRRKKEFKQWVSERKREWKLEDTLRTLDCTTLKAMDRVMRDEDEARLQADEASMLRDDAAAGRNIGDTEPHEDAQPTVDSRRPIYPVSEQHVQFTSATATAFDEDMIDPLLRSHPLGVQPVPPSAAKSTPGERLDATDAPAYTLPYVQFRPRTPPFSPTSLVPESTQPTSRASSVAAKPLVESQLAAAARRKLQKRLHMRRKRAEARGLSTVSTAVRLKAGRKRSEKVLRGPTAYTKPASRGSQDAFAGDATSGPSEDVGGHPDGGGRQFSSESPPSKRSRHHHVSGVTLPYKLLRKLRDVGLDADRLQEECVGVMNLKGLTRLMRLYNRLHDVDVTVSSQISSEVIKLLNAHALHFTMEAMHRVIDMREQERESKRYTKGWRLGKFDRVSHVHVEQALSMLGCKSVTKKARFDGLLERQSLKEEDFDDANPEVAEAGESSSEEEADDERSTHEVIHGGSEDEDELAFDPLSFPIHRATLPPVVHFPATEALPLASGIPRSLDVALYMPWPASSASAEPLLEEDLMSEDTDTDALVEDLLDEEQLDEHDRRLEEACEESLWIEFGANPPKEAQPRPRRKRKRAAEDDGEESDA